jgi:hypothetical protein
VLQDRSAEGNEGWIRTPRRNLNEADRFLIPHLETLSIPPLASQTNDAGDSFRFIRVSGCILLLPRLVLNNPNPVHR